MRTTSTRPELLAIPRQERIDALVKQLVADVLADPTGGLGPSVYETARLVTLVPWLDGHRERVRFLLSRQQADGGWGGPEGYGLVPTLSAIEALLAASEQAGLPQELRREAALAAERGMDAALRLLAESQRTGVPNTVVAMMIIPALISDINARQARRLPLPPGMDDTRLGDLRRDGWHNPLAGHYLEIVGPAAVQAPHLRPVDGVIGCSVAATAAWLGPREPGPRCAESVEFMRRTQERGGGPVPAMTSVAYYERAWILGNLAASGTAVDLLRPLADELPPDTARTGAPTAPGFAYEAETSAIILAAFARLGPAHEPAYLWQYDAGTHFRSTIPEFTPSTSTNAHVMGALGSYLDVAPQDGERYADAIERIARWLGEQQQDDGTWIDKWHASPYFSTMRCAVALREHADAAHRPTVARAVDGVLAGQHGDGSFGRWGGTVEETAYAVQTLLRATDPDDARAAAAARQGCAFLVERLPDTDHPELWIGKELYAPVHMVRGAVLGALQLARSRW
ncbi:prenyltransferase/squalene oxidase repeat-containing protein [Streptomyces sp. NPDC057638]|uniref:prenyltransferase/squalene oxidase repeat-containing protein n=1 Tax=Streptomyces sp. NPDC057638 TaxID=3346190 RepID=UPI00367D5C49